MEMMDASTIFNCDLIVKFIDTLEEEYKELYSNYEGDVIEINCKLLPEDYIYFLRRFNGFSLFGDEVLGIGNQQNDLFTLTKWEQNESNNLMPIYIIPFSAVGNGDHYCFDLKDGLNENGQCPIIYWQWNYSTEENYEIVNSSFVEWLKELIEDSLIDEEE